MQHDFDDIRHCCRYGCAYGIYDCFDWNIGCGNYYFTDKFLLYYIFALDLSMISYYNTASTKSYFFMKGIFYER